METAKQDSSGIYRSEFLSRKVMQQNEKKNRIQVRSKPTTASIRGGQKESKADKKKAIHSETEERLLEQIEELR